MSSVSVNENGGLGPFLRGFLGDWPVLVDDIEMHNRQWFPSSPNILTEAKFMDDTAYQGFFTEPTQTYHRRYEALRTVFVDGRPQKEVAEAFGFTYGSMRQLVHEFRRCFDAERSAAESPFFGAFGPDRRQPVKTRTQTRRLRTDGS